ncbi:hypothetical protein [Alkalicoccus chagannorensis]|uniref:hypothetical protein n=1 Tax=Alkalicoccus chagannorensis TaxID=427072 RepID=UPI0003FEBEDF|nr:hypothetical protein [Alkalicoccus chagannorensis]
MSMLKDMTSEQRRDSIITFVLIGIAVVIGIVVGRNEEWFSPANFSAGYMAGSLLSVILLFAVYRSIAFVVNLLRGGQTKSDQR